MEFVNELILSKDNLREQLLLLKKNSNNQYVQEYIKTLEESEYLSDYVRYMIDRYYYGNDNAIKKDKNCVEKTFKVVLRPVEIKKRVFTETDIKVGDYVSIINGPFKGIDGKIGKVNKDRGLFIILINLFDEEFDIEVEFEYVVKKEFNC